MTKGKRHGITHAMRNERVEELFVEGEAKVTRNRTGESGRAGQSGEKESERGSREEEVRRS
jgi:hypothetical protein